MSTPPPVLCIAGPTAAGKTAAALALAHERSIEIISMDSALVYRGMDIGTAKPTLAERAQVPHHLIDIRDPGEPYSAAQFVADAQRLVPEIRARGALPVLVGGTMLYYKALVQGLDAMPAADPAVRAALEHEAAAVGWPAMHAQLALVDPTTAQRLHPTDSQRVQRALEVWRVSGKPLSSFHVSTLSAMQSIAKNDHSTPAYRLLSLEPAARSWLHARIAVRFDSMLAEGLLGEVKALRSRGDLSADLPSMRCVGYRQVWEALDESDAQDIPMEALMPALRERSIAATRQLAKRQLTWMRSFAQRSVVACDAPDAIAQVLALANSLTHTSEHASA